jgi:riboflavin synthase alpha subunit
MIKSLAHGSLTKFNNENSKRCAYVPMAKQRQVSNSNFILHKGLWFVAGLSIKVFKISVCLHVISMTTVNGYMLSNMNEIKINFVISLNALESLTRCADY